MSLVIEKSIKILKESITDMMTMIGSQLEKAETCLFTGDKDILIEIKQLEKIIDRTDSVINKECENIFALYSPLASDLRFIIAGIYISYSLERIGDLCIDIARYVKEDCFKDLDPKILEAVHVKQIFEIVRTQLNDSIYTYINEDLSLSKDVMKTDTVIHELKKGIATSMSEFLEKNPDQTKNGLYIYSIVNKLVRISNLSTDIVESTIYYLKAESLKHKKYRVKKSEIKTLIHNIIEEEEDSAE